MLEDQIREICAKYKGLNSSPEHWKFFSLSLWADLFETKEEFFMIEEFISITSITVQDKVKYEVMLLVDITPLEICLTSPYAFVRECKEWLIKNYP